MIFVFLFNLFIRLSDAVVAWAGFTAVSFCHHHSRVKSAKINVILIHNLLNLIQVISNSFKIQGITVEDCFIVFKSEKNLNR